MVKDPLKDVVMPPVLDFVYFILFLEVQKVSAASAPLSSVHQSPAPITSTQQSIPMHWTLELPTQDSYPIQGDNYAQYYICY